MVTKILSATLVLVGSTLLLSAAYLAADTAVAAPTVASVEIVHEANQPAQLQASVPTTPVLVSIPSIKLNAPVVEVGLNSKGEMDVPSGDTNDVGWYKHGTTPGNEGSAVLDAHVYAALKDLRYAKVGDSVYVKDAAGVTRQFVIRSSMVYELASVPRELLFNRSGGTYLNIITCAGKFVPAMDTYDHRLIVYAELVND